MGGALIPDACSVPQENHRARKFDRKEKAMNQTQPGMAVLAAPATTPAAMEIAFAILAICADPAKYKALLDGIAAREAKLTAELAAQQEKLAAEMAAAHATRSAELDKREKAVAARESEITMRENAAEAIRAEFTRRRDSLRSIVGDKSPT
jgi:hypothetical protein